MNKFTLAAISAVVIALLATLGYFIFQNQKLISALSKNPQASAQNPSPTPASTPSPSPSPSPKVDRKTLEENIQAGVNSQNTQALATYMTNPVQVVLQATECCEPQTPDEAVSQLEYVAEGIPFTFDQNNETIKNLKAKNPELANQHIGISQNKQHLIAFEINPQNKISGMRLSVSYTLFTQ